MDIQLLHLTAFNGYEYSIFYLFVSVVYNYSQNIAFANSLKMQKQGWSSRRADQPRSGKKAERPEATTPPPGGIGGDAIPGGPNRARDSAAAPRLN